MANQQSISDKSDFHSPEVDEIMGRLPSWILRWGITVLFVIFGGIITMSWFISAPQSVVGEIMLSSDNPSVQLSAGTSGKLILLHDSSDSSILEGMPIACIGKYADYERVLRVDSCLQQSYNNSASTITDWPRIDSLPDELRNQYNAFRLTYRTVLFDRSREELESGIRTWKTKHLLTAPISGILIVTAGSYVRVNEPVAQIMPEGETGIIGRMQVSAGYDQIQPGMNVWIQIPVMETDKDIKQQGIISRVVPLADTEDDLIYVDITDDIPNRWHTLLRMRSLYGTAEIVIKEGSLFQKFLPFKSFQQ